LGVSEKRRQEVTMYRSLVSVIAFLIVAAAPVLGQTKTGGVVREYKNPPGLSTPRGYSHTVSVSGGRTVYVAGQVAYNAQGEVVGKGDLRAQTRQAFENLRIALAAAGGSFKDLVKINTYVVGYKPDQLTILREVRAEMLKDLTPPASTLVGVQGLVNPDLLIEIVAIAVID
jgi:enamine deaminase RidA (YjgF/YER057c/UK114 family)